MKLELELDGKTLAVEFSYADGLVQLKHADQVHKAIISEPEPGLFVVLLNNRVYRCSPEQSPAGAAEVIVNGQRIPITVRDKKHLRSGAGGGASATGKASLTSPMPGKIVRVLVSAGDEVAANQGLLIVEAMKMQNEVLAPKAGKVTEVRVVEGQTVNAGETLAVIE
ncbi:MAG: acetyl-CoA carboxylase biotin carboxyl carrier protein subunit [Blastocatellia bacterium]